ncbi:MAG TPA: hypothetical protein PKE63_06540 [Lacibacter sp.]|nr:hypothetical protein [Lacibacter sp.]HMO87725.1 hypothetical protein [Lacibacter sp.]HMP86918.1 hypothetical protein [Lacibacter sp.]
MNRLLLFILLIVHLPLQAQYPRPAELFDAVVLFAIDSVKGVDYLQAGDWLAGSGSKSPFRWRSETPEWQGDQLVRKAQAVLTIRGVSLVCKPATNEPCNWNLTLSGARAGYLQYSLVSAFHPNNKGRTPLEDIFPGKNFKARLLKTCDQNERLGFYVYELLIPGKRSLLLKQSWLCQPNGCATSLVLHLAPEDADTRCPGESK